MELKRGRPVNSANSRVRIGMTLFAVLAVTACSGNGGGGESPDPSPPTAGPPATYVQTPFVILDSITADDFRYNDDARVTVNGRPAALEDLHDGEIAMIQGTRTYKGGLLDSVGIESIDVRHLVIGPVESVDLHRARLTVMGQEVSVTGDTIVDDATVSNGGLEAIQPGDAVAVSGFFAASGGLVATRISRRTSEGDVLLRGVVAASDPAANRFRVGRLDVYYGQAEIDLQDFPSGTPSVGDVVLLRANVAPVGAVLDANSVAFVPRTLGVAENAEVYLTGAISFRSGADLDVDGVQVNLYCAGSDCGSDPRLLRANALVHVIGKYDAAHDLVQARLVLLAPDGPVGLTARIGAIESGTQALTALGFQVQSFAFTQLGDEPYERTTPVYSEDLQVGDTVTATGTYGGVPGLLIASSIRRVPAQDPRIYTWRFERADPAIIVLGRSILTNSSTIVDLCESPIDARRLFSDKDRIDALAIGLQASPANSLEATRVSIYNHGC